MGIRFYCPNGHKLNVKEFQAGRRGVCPYCGARMQVPLKSTRPSSRKLSQQPPAADDVLHEETAAITPPTTQALTKNAAVPDPGDPLATSGELVWYVRTNSGEQYGPALADVMRSWLSGGRIGADMLVWREGWPQWRVAGEVFPQLARQFKPSVPKAQPKPPPSFSVPRAASVTLTKPPQVSKPAKSKMALWVVASLALAAILLFVIFLVVLLLVNR